MRFRSVEHAEYKILQHLRRSGALPLSVVMDRGIPGYELGAGPNQILTDERDQNALNRYNTACENLASILTGLLETRKKRVPEADLKLMHSPYLDTWGNRTTDYGPEDDLMEATE